MSQTDRPAFSVPARVLVLQNLQVIAKVVGLTLCHGVYVTREAKDVAEAKYLIEDWKPHLAILDMDSGAVRCCCAIWVDLGWRDTNTRPGHDSSRRSAVKHRPSSKA